MKLDPVSQSQSSAFLFLKSFVYIASMEYTKHSIKTPLF